MNKINNHADKLVIEKLSHYIEQNLSDTTISIDRICKDLGVSRSQLHRLIKEQTQLSTTLFIRKQRLSKARNLLETTNLHISEIADTVGIDGPQNFSKYFAAEFGRSPSEYRRYTKQATLTSHYLPTKLTQFPNVTIASNLLSNKKTKKNWQWWVAGTMLILLTSATIWKLKSNTFVSDSFDNSIAILPFKTLGATNTSYLSEGVMEQIHTSLALIEGLKVISNQSSSQYTNTTKTIPQIAHELDVKYILEGAVLQVESKISITIQLTKAENGQVVWGNIYEGDAKDIFSFISNIAKTVAVELNQKLSTKVNKKIKKMPTKNIVAYQELLQGEQLMQARTKDKLEASLEKFNHAIKLDSAYAHAYTNLALCYILMGDSKYIDVNESYKMTEKNALKAIRLDSENGLAYAALANIYRDQNKWEQANTTYQIAIKYNPNDALINYWYSLMLRTTGNLNEAIKYSTKAVSLDPLYHVVYGGHIYNCVLANRLDIAQQKLQEGEKLFGSSWVYQWAKGSFYIAKKDYQQALLAFTKSYELNPNEKNAKREIYYCKAQLGQTKEVNQYLQTLPDNPDFYIAKTIIYAGLEDKPNCLKYLQKNAALNLIPTDLKVSLFFKFLHQDKQFRFILQQFGLGETYQIELL